MKKTLTETILFSQTIEDVTIIEQSEYGHLHQGMFGMLFLQTNLNIVSALACGLFMWHL